MKYKILFGQRVVEPLFAKDRRWPPSEYQLKLANDIPFIYKVSRWPNVSERLFTA